MLLLPLVLISLCYGAAEAFVGAPTMLAGRSNAVCELLNHNTQALMIMIDDMYEYC